MSNEIPIVTTNSELENLSRLLRIEIIVELLLTFVIIMLKNQIKEIVWYMSLLIAFCGLVFSFYSFYLNKKVRLEDSSFLFLNNATEMLKHFAFKYTLFIQVILFLSI